MSWAVSLWALILRVSLWYLPSSPSSLSHRLAHQVLRGGDQGETTSSSVSCFFSLYFLTAHADVDRVHTLAMGITTACSLVFVSTVYPVVPL